MEITSLKRVLHSNKVKHTITFILTFIFVYLILATSLVTKKYDLKEGDIAKVNIKAPREIADEQSTEDRRKQERENVGLKYEKKIEVQNLVIDDINRLFYQSLQIKDTNEEEKIKAAKLKSGSPVVLPDDLYTALIKANKDDLKVLQEFLLKTMTEIYDGNITENNQEDIKRAQENILLKFNSSQLSKTLRDLGTAIGYLEVKPNLFYDAKKTEELRAEAEKKVRPVLIQKDQIIVKEGELVTAHQIEILKDLGLINSNSNFDSLIYLSLAVLVMLILVLQWFFLYRYYPKVYNDSSKMMLISILTCVSLVLARTLSIISPYLIPLACIPMLFTLLISYKISLTINVINCILISAAVGFKIEITLLAVVNSVVGAIILKKLQQRNDIMISSLYISVINVLLTFSVGFLLSNSVADVITKGAYAVVASIVSGVLTIGFLPFFESIFDIVTTIKLLELSNPNHPLLKKLLVEAPGTYHHSILVANLAEVAVEEVGGNPVLARVSCYYHDIGKIRRPYFFKENQMGNDNPHDKITPNLSTLIITSHVKDGIELAKEHNIPMVVRDIIEQHHGNSLVKYFYITAKNSCEKPEDINEEDFKYSGPTPVTKEAGIIMLADGVEAAVRSINPPTAAKIEEMVNNIIKCRLDEGQLDNCDLTLRDLEKIKRTFLKTLNGIYHQRIEYPTDKWIDEETKYDIDRQQTK